MKLPFAKAAGLALLMAAAHGAASAEWTRTWAIEWYEPAHYYGAETGIIDPGTDCPKGTNPEPDWIGVLKKAGYTEQEALWLRDPSHPYRVPNHGQNQMAFRGEGRANVYVHPELAADPGMQGVTGTIGEGLDLDGDKTNGFVSVDGKTTGIDNQFYRTMGCWKYFRGPPRLSYNAESRNDEMREGRWTVLIVASGEGDDPMNDDKVRVGFYDSTDKLVKDGNGDIATGYTFRIQPHARFEAILEAKTVDGVIVSTSPTKEIWLRDPSYARELQLLQAQLQLTMKDDGSLSGILAGYRPWKRLYQGMVEARGSVIEQLTWAELPGVWNALKRGADYSPDGANGEKTHISFALKIDAVRAYVMTPDASRKVSGVRSYKSEAPPMGPSLHAFFSNRFRVTDGLVPDSDGVILAGPDAPILPPTVTGAELRARLKASAKGAD
ncbi:hypothetical protein GC169_06550 [bacterium]|nr:hypothetical protein [bacterium]